MGDSARIGVADDTRDRNLVSLGSVFGDVRNEEANSIEEAFDIFSDLSHGRWGWGCGVVDVVVVVDVGDEFGHNFGVGVEWRSGGHWRTWRLVLVLEIWMIWMIWTRNLGYAS